MKKIPVYLFLILFAHVGVSQNSFIYPLSLLRTSDNFILDNPASGVLNPVSRLQLNTGYYTGLSGKVGVNFLNGDLKLDKVLNSEGHMAGVILHSEFETELLKRTRAYFRYSYTAKVASDFRIAAGMQVGFFNYFVKSTLSSAGSSSFVPDASAGICLKGNHFSFGISASHLFNSIVQPIRSPYKLQRYISLNAEYKLINTLSYEVDGMARIVFADNNSSVNPGVRIILMKNFSAEVNYLFKRGIVFSAGAINFPFLTQKATLHLSYFKTSGFENLLNVNRIEICLRVDLQRLQKD